MAQKWHSSYSPLPALNVKTESAFMNFPFSSTKRSILNFSGSGWISVTCRAILPNMLIQLPQNRLWCEKTLCFSLSLSLCPSVSLSASLSLFVSPYLFLSLTHSNSLILSLISLSLSHSHSLFLSLSLTLTLSLHQHCMIPGSMWAA